MLTKSIPTKVAAFGGLDIFVPENRPKNEDHMANYYAWTHAWENVDPFHSSKTIEDNLTAIITYRNNVKVTFNCVSCCAWDQRRMRISCTGGTIEMDLHDGAFKWQKLFSKLNEEKLPGGIHGCGDQVMISEFCDIMAFGGKPRVSIEEGFTSVVVCLAIDEARKTGTVVDLEKYWKEFGI